MEDSIDENAMASGSLGSRLRNAVSTRPALITLLIWNVIIFLIGIYQPDIPYILSLHIPAETAGPASDFGVTLLRLLTYTFIHNSPGHLLANMIWLLLFGYVLYPRLGSLRFLLLYFASGFGGGLLFIAVAKFGGLATQGSILTLSGSSAAALGITACAWILIPDSRIFLQKMIQVRTLAFIAIILTFIINPILNPALLPTAAHAGGALTGTIAGIKLRHRFKKPKSR